MYYSFLIYFAAAGKGLRDRNFTIGVELKNLLQKYYVFFGNSGAQIKYEEIRTKMMPEYEFWEEKLKSLQNISPGVLSFLDELTNEQKKYPFYKGYCLSLIVDELLEKNSIINGRFLSTSKGLKSFAIQEELCMINTLIQKTYPEVYVTDEVANMCPVKYIPVEDTKTLRYVNWEALKMLIDYLRSFDFLYGDIEKITHNILNN